MKKLTFLKSIYAPWRWLTAFVLLFTLAIGQMWAADETIFLWQYDGSSTYGDGSTTGAAVFDMTATTGTIKFVTCEKKKTGTDGTIGYNASVTDNDLKPSISNGLKLGNNGAHLRISPASGNFKAGDVIYICGHTPVLVTTSTDPTSTAKITTDTGEGGKTTVLASSLALGTAKGSCAVGSITLPVGFSETDKIYISRVPSTSVAIAAIKVVRPSSGGGDTQAPTLSSSNPANSATDVAVSGNIVLTFDEAIASVDANKFTLTGATKGTVTIDGTDAKKVNVGYTAENNASVTLAVAAEAVADAAGNKSAALSNISFTTVAGTSYPEGYIYITDVMATPETGASATTSSMNSYNTNLNSNFDKGNFTGTKYAITSSSSGYYTLTFSPALDVSTYSNLKLDVWWGTNGTGSNSGIKVNVNGTEVYSATTTQSTRNKIQTGLDRAITATSISTIQLKGSNNSGTVFFRVGIKGESTPSCSAPTSPAISGETSYIEGDNISLTASASDTDGSTTYTWYKGANWATASAGSSIGSTATFTKNSCVEGDAGTYWCNISNGTGCEVQISKTITVSPAVATKHGITYNTESLKGQSVSGYPTEFTEGVGLAASSFPALADVEDFHFDGWDPASIGTAVTADVEMFATWVDAFDVTFALGTGASGTAPASFQKWEGATFELPGQGSMEAPSGKAFDGWKANGVGEKRAAGYEYTMGNAPVEFVAQWKAVPTTIFNWTKGTGANIAEDKTSLNGNNMGTMATGTSIVARLLGTNTISNNNAGYKLDKDDICIEIQGTVDFEEGDTVKITAQGGGDGARGCVITSSEINTSACADTARTNLIDDKNNARVYTVIVTDNQAGEKIRVFRMSGKNMYIKGIQVIRPAAREIASTVITLTGVKVNNHSISADSLAMLQATGHSLMLKDAYAEAPEIKFNEHKVITYVEGEPAQKVTDKEYTVTATTSGDNWQAQQQIGETTYTVNAVKISSATVTYKLGTKTLGSEVVAINGHPAEFADYQSLGCATFSGWYDNDGLTGDAVNLAEATITQNVTFYAKFTYKYASSFNIEQWVLTNGAGKGNGTKTNDMIGQMGSANYESNIAWSNTSNKQIELDSLSVKSDSLRNYAYLGLKVKNSGQLLNFRLAPGSVAKVKFGDLKMIPQVKINDGDYAAMSITDGVYTYTATGEDLISIYINQAEKAVVFKQIMIDEDLVTVMPAINYSEAENGSISGLKLGIPGETIKVYPIPAEGYVVDAVTVNGNAITPTAGVYSFEMPNAAANVVATFAVYVPPTYSVTYVANNGTADQIVDLDASVIAANTFAYADHIFAGWNTQADGNGDAYAVGDPVTENLELYAQWRSYFTITYMDGEDQLDTENVFEGEAPVGIADPVKAFNLFKGWTLSGSDEVIDVTTLTASTTVYAKWEVIDACFYFGAKSVTANEDITTVPATLNTTYGGGSVEATSGDFTYTPYGVLIAGGGDKYFTVTLDKAVTTGSKITVVMAAASTGDRGLNICYEANKNSKAYDQMHWEATELGQERTFTYTLDEESALKDKKVFYLYRNNNVYLKSITVEDCAPEQYTVTYMDGENSLGTEQVYENAHPTANGINTHKKGYEFQGWAETATGVVVDLNAITISAAKTLYAQYTVKDCPTSGNLFTWAYDPTATDITYNLTRTTSTEDNDVEVVSETDVVTVSGGQAYLGTTSSSSTATVTDGVLAIRLNSSNYAKIVLDCPLQVGDKISYTADNAREHGFYKDEISGDAVSSVNKQLVIDSDTHPLYDADVLYVQGTNGDSQFKTFSIVRLAPVTGVSLADATVAIGNTVTPTMTLLPSNEAYYESIAWSIVGEGAGTIANINATTGAVTALAAGTVTVQIKLNNSESLKATCQVEVVASFEQVDVTESTVWDMNNVSASAIELPDNKRNGLLLANVNGVNNNASFNSQALYFEGQHIGRTSNNVKHLAGRKVQFNVTVPGAVLVTFASNGSNQRTVAINDTKCTRTTDDNEYITYALAVEPGSVEIVGYQGTSANQYVRISRIEFKAEDNYHRTVNPNNIGTLCWTNNAILGGATLYELNGKNENNYLVFDEVEENRLVAGKPYIFVPENGNTEIKVYNTDNATALEQDDLQAVNGMMGTFVELSSADGTTLWGNYIISKNHYIFVDSNNVILGANRAYITSLDDVAPANQEPAPTQNGAPRRRLVMGGNAPAVATDVDNIYGNDTKVQKILINGQLFIIRGDKTYDATGRLVK